MNGISLYGDHHAAQPGLLITRTGNVLVAIMTYKLAWFHIIKPLSIYCPFLKITLSFKIAL